MARAGLLELAEKYEALARELQADDPPWEELRKPLAHPPAPALMAEQVPATLADSGDAVLPCQPGIWS